MHITLPSPAPSADPLVEWLGSAGTLAPLSVAAPLDVGAALVVAFAAAFLVGVILFVRDCIVLRRCVRDWRTRSRPAAGLRALLPLELADLPAEIRIVEQSAVAAVTGLLRPTVWLGDRHTDAHRVLVLTHELWHVRVRDPWWLFAIAAVRRAYWWNPLVAYVARQAVLMIEAACDQRCAAQLGRAHYRGQLASLLLAANLPAPRLMAAANGGNLDVQRLRLLGEPLQLRARDLMLIAMLSAGAIATTAAAVVERLPQLREDRSLGTDLPETPAGAALTTLIRAVNGDNAELIVELLGAYTPQELPLPLPLPLPEGSTVRVVEITHSEPLRIEYVVESSGGVRYAGALAVSAASPQDIIATRLRPLP
jgi:beta-lactamase regulating signal transducer with metallopeptidase domain